MGDLNLDLFKVYSGSRGLNYYLQLVSYGLFPAILRATRVNSTNVSLSDNIWTSISEMILQSGIILCDILDQHQTFGSFGLNGSAYHRPPALAYKKCQPNV